MTLADITSYSPHFLWNGPRAEPAHWDYWKDQRRQGQHCAWCSVFARSMLLMAMAMSLILPGAVTALTAPLRVSAPLLLATTPQMTSPCHSCPTWSASKQPNSQPLCFGVPILHPARLLPVHLPPFTELAVSS